MTRVLSAAVLTLVAASTGAAGELSTLTGKKYTGTLAGIEAGVLTVNTTSGAVGVSVKDIHTFDFGPPAVVPKGKFDELELTDGSVFHCSKVLIRGKQVQFDPIGTGDTLPSIAVPLETVFSIARGADDPKARDDWKKLVAGRGKRDLFVVRQGDVLNPVAGTVLDGNEVGDTIRFEREDGQTVSYKLIRATGGIVFNQPPRGVIPPTLCKVHDTFGNVLTAETVAVIKDGLSVRTVSGATILYPKLAAVSKLDFSQGNVAFLSDLEPQVSAPEPTPDRPQFVYFRDRTDENGQLTLDGTSYAKGLWLAPDAALTYKLNGDYREFKTIVGVDDTVQVATSTSRLIVEADGKVIYNQVVSRKDKPRAVTLDVKGVKQLKLALEREGLFLGNQLNLADARVQK